MIPKVLIWLFEGLLRLAKLLGGTGARSTSTSTAGATLLSCLLLWQRWTTTSPKFWEDVLPLPGLPTLATRQRDDSPHRDKSGGFLLDQFRLPWPGGAGMARSAVDLEYTTATPRA